MKTPMKKPGDKVLMTAKSFFYWEGETLVLNILGKPGQAGCHRQTEGSSAQSQRHRGATGGPGNGSHGAISGRGIRRGHGRHRSRLRPHECEQTTAHPLPQAIASDHCAAGIVLLRQVELKFYSRRRLIHRAHSSHHAAVTDGVKASAHDAWAADADARRSLAGRP